jgi:hypothetical protein
LENEVYSLMDLMLLSLEDQLKEGLFEMLLPQKIQKKNKKRSSTILHIIFNKIQFNSQPSLLVDVNNVEKIIAGENAKTRAVY